MWARLRTRLARSSMPQSQATANLPAPSGRGTSFHPVPRQSWQFSRGIVFVLKDRIRGRGEEGKRGCGRFVNQENSHPQKRSVLRQEAERLRARLAFAQ